MCLSRIDMCFSGSSIDRRQHGHLIDRFADGSEIRVGIRRREDDVFLVVKRCRETVRFRPVFGYDGFAKVGNIPNVMKAMGVS